MLLFSGVSVRTGISNVQLSACRFSACACFGLPCRDEILLRKEVIQPHVPVRLPCYDFTLLTGHSLDGFFLTVRPPALRAPDSDGVTGGVYKARERIHRGLADPRLLAIPTSCSRVADCNPNWDWLYGIRSTFRSRCPLYQPL